MLKARVVDTFGLESGSKNEKEHEADTQVAESVIFLVLDDFQVDLVCDHSSSCVLLICL